MLSELKKTELQSICRKHRIRGYSKLNKSELVKLLYNILIYCIINATFKSC